MREQRGKQKRDEPRGARQLPIILALGTSQTLAWASSYYLPAVLADPGARVIEAWLLSRYHPLLSTELACLGHPIGAAILAIAGGGAAGIFAICHGADNGILTISRGTLPLAIFGARNYAYRLGSSARRPGWRRQRRPCCSGCCSTIWAAAS
jgi:hypothetical protein